MLRSNLPKAFDNTEFGTKKKIKKNTVKKKSTVKKLITKKDKPK